VNLLLIDAAEVAPDGRVCLTGRRQQHANEVLRVQSGDTLQVGLKGGLVGEARVLRDTPSGLELDATFTETPPPRACLDVILAMPRPKALKKVIPALAMLGVDRVVLVNSARVEKSYFGSKVLEPEFLAQLVELGLEQARDTIGPVFEIRERFRPFVEDELGAWLRPKSSCLLPHPTARARLGPVPREQHLTLAIGPDGGWVPFEVELLSSRGFSPVSLGPRVLRVEVAVPTIIGALRPYL
jgi:RsmE family RNA methyltransferase